VSLWLRDPADRVGVFTDFGCIAVRDLGFYSNLDLRCSSCTLCCKNSVQFCKVGWVNERLNFFSMASTSSLGSMLFSSIQCALVEIWRYLDYFERINSL